MYIINKIIKYFYPDEALEAAKKDYSEYFNTPEFQNYKNHHDLEILPVAHPITPPKREICYLKSIHETMKAMEEMDLNDKILTAIEIHNRMIEEVIKLKDGSIQTEDIEMKEFRKPGRTPGSKCLCH